MSHQSFGLIPDPAAVRQIVVEGATPDALVAKLTAAIADTSQLPVGALITAIDLFGGSDGNAFMALLTWASGTPTLQAIGGIINVPDTLAVQAYAFNDPAGLAAQRANLTFDDDVEVRAEIFAFAGQGPRGMGLILTQVVEDDGGPPNAVTPVGTISGTGLAGALGVGTNDIVGAAAAGITLESDTSLYFDSPAAGRLRYIGPGRLLCMVRGGVSVELATPFTATASIITDPAGTPVQQNDGMPITLAVGLVGYVQSSSPVVFNNGTEVGLRVVSGGTGTMRGAELVAEMIGSL